MIDLKETNFEQYITNYLVDHNGFLLRGADESRRPVKDKDYDRSTAFDIELLGQFIQSTQPNEWTRLHEIYGDQALENFTKRLDQELTQIGVLEVLRQGVTDRGVHIDLMYRKPNSGYNPEAETLYSANLFSVMRQVYFSPRDERSVDTVLFINGLPVITLELKNQLTGQNVEHAKHQYKIDRAPSDKLFGFKRALVHFALDNNLAFMTTKIDGMKTYFLPFNRGHNNGKGNPPVDGKFATHYLWEDVFVKDSLAELITRFMHVTVEKKKDPKSGRVTKKETLLFPRYHQREVVRELIADAREHGAGKNYLIQHSAGSGKSNSIAWTAHNLSDLHDANDRKVFDKIIIITDRRVLDKQLRDTVSQFEQQRDVVKGVTRSSELREALQDKTKIIVTTLQKFPVIVEDMSQLSGNTFAVIVDEAHSSQSGESTKALKQTLSKLDDAESQDEANREVDPETQFALDAQAARGRLPHVSFFAFTATPKEKTLELFGQQDGEGKYHPFSLYSMKQAVEEGFILDVLQNYTTHKMYFELAQKAKELDPEFEKKKAYRLAISYADLHEHGIEKKAELMVEHFRSQIERLIEGKAKAMIVTKSRLHAVRYYLAIRDYLARQGYPEKAIVAFSGTVVDASRGGIEYTEANLNGFSETETVEKFDSDEFKFLIVANKYQTGFDQPKLAAMYVDKKLGGVATVQTLSRLNRTMGKAKDGVFVLDFVNAAEDIQKDFQPYYTSTILSESTDPNILYDLKRDISGAGVFGELEVQRHYQLLLSNDQTNQAVVAGLIDEAVQNYETLDDDDKEAFRDKIVDFVRKYAFIAQLFDLSDPYLEQFYEYTRNLAKKLPKVKDPLPTELLDYIDLSSIAISKGKKNAIGLVDAEGELEPMSSNSRGAKPIDEMERLSLIVKGINEQFGLPEGMEKDGMLLISRIRERNDVKKAISNNPKGAAREHFNEVMQEELMKMFSERADFYKKLDEDVALKETIAEKIFEEMYTVSNSEK
ncbi:type I restriction endonuclease subunit R [Microbacteriaceae bacterium]|nr:type I restriction endonuclease subunit R [Candidatus Saccharibacteria bacterium]